MPRRVVAASCVAMFLILALPVVPGVDEPTEGPSTSPAAVYRDSGGSFRDFTSQANSETTGDITLGGGRGDSLYVGHGEVFDQAVLDIATAGAGGEVLWEYSTAAGWRELEPSDATDGLRRQGLHAVSWTPPSDWAPTQAGDQAPGTFYYLRGKVTSPYAGSAVLSKVRLEAWSEPASVLTEKAIDFQPAFNLGGRMLYDVASLSNARAVAVGATGLIMRSPDWGERWSVIPSQTTEDLRGLAVNGARIVVVGTSGTILRSTDAGMQWTKVAAPVLVNLVSVAWSTGDTVYAVGGEVVLRSRDAGLTWTELQRFQGKVLEDIDMDGAFGIIVGNDAGGVLVFKKPIDASTFASVTVAAGVGLTARALKIRPDPSGAGGRDIWIVGDRFKMKSESDGADFQAFVDAASLRDVVIAGPTEAWFVGRNAIEHVNDDGPVPRFTVLFVNEATPDAQAIAVRNPTALMIAGNGVLMRSLKTTETWWQCLPALTDDITAVQGLPSGRVWAVGKRGLVLRSPDLGANYSTLFPPMENDLTALDVADSGAGWIAGSQGFIRRTDDPERTWDGPPSDGGVPTTHDITGLSIGGTDRRHGVLVTNLGAVFTTEDGVTWSQASAPPAAAGLRAVDHYSSTGAVAVGPEGTVLASADGTTWFSRPRPGDHISVHFADSTHGWIGDADGKVLATSDAALTWTSRDPGTTGAIGAVHGSVTGRLWAVSSANVAHRSNNGGLNWTTLNVPTTGSLMGVAASSGPVVVVGTGGAYSRSWSAFGNVTERLSSHSSFVADQSHSAGDAVYIGDEGPFDSVVVGVATPGARGAVVRWEYWDGTDWAALASVDQSDSFRHEGLSTIQYPLPTDWSPTKVAGEGADRYWVRARFQSPPEAAPLIVSDVAILRLPVPVESERGPIAPPTDSVPGFGMYADPAVLHFGPVGRGQKATQWTAVVGREGVANATVTVEGPAAAWIRISTTAFEVAADARQVLQVELLVPETAPPGPADARIVVTARPSGAAVSVRGWIPVDLTVAAADLGDVVYEPAASAWTATFVNHLLAPVHVSIGATARSMDGAAHARPGNEADVAPATVANATGDLKGLDPGPHDLIVTAAFNGEVRTRELRVFVGGAPVILEDLAVEVTPRLATFGFTVRNNADVPLQAATNVRIEDLGGATVAVVDGPKVELTADASSFVSLSWEPEFGVYTVHVGADVAHAVSASQESVFTVQGRAPHEPAGVSPLVWFGLAAVLIVGAAVAIGVYTGRRRPPV